jgi:hypothetical protein
VSRVAAMASYQLLSSGSFQNSLKFLAMKLTCVGSNVWVWVFAARRFEYLAWKASSKQPIHIGFYVPLCKMHSKYSAWQRTYKYLGQKLSIVNAPINQSAASHFIVSAYIWTDCHSSRGQYPRAYLQCVATWNYLIPSSALMHLTL